MNQAPAAYPLDGIHARGYRGRTDTDHPADVAGMCPYPWCHRPRAAVHLPILNSGTAPSTRMPLPPRRRPGGRPVTPRQQHSAAVPIGDPASAHPCSLEHPAPNAHPRPALPRHHPRRQRPLQTPSRRRRRLLQRPRPVTPTSQSTRVDRGH
jgi:hypothetical protein